mmetsp:Transcript_9320/g.16825  ORF Transcript_9320/g.16825 Transcript_9320/m.16825 type:complete len:199 (-) Transcript_9320:1214-1810(-)
MTARSPTRSMEAEWDGRAQHQALADASDVSLRRLAKMATATQPQLQTTAAARTPSTNGNSSDDELLELSLASVLELDELDVVWVDMVDTLVALALLSVVELDEVTLVLVLVPVLELDKEEADVLEVDKLEAEVLELEEVETDDIDVLELDGVVADVGELDDVGLEVLIKLDASNCITRISLPPEEFWPSTIPDTEPTA